MRKVTWPTQREYVGGTIGVVVILALMTLVLGVVDYVLAQAIRLIVP
jgi:preprotein translocase SecE subunit